MADPASLQPEQPSQPTRFGPLYRNVSFTLMWSSTAASGFGDRMIMLAAGALLGIHLADTNASSINAGINLFFFLPYFFFGLLGGWIADTLPRKWVLLGCDESRGILLLLAMLMVPIGVDSAVPADYHWRIYGLLLCVGLFAAVFTPTRNAAIPQIVPMRQLQSANAVIMCIAVVFSLLGMGVGGWLIVGEDSDTVRTGLLIGALLYLISGTFFAFLRPKKIHRLPIGPKKNERQRIVQAARYILDHKRILRLVFYNMLFWGSAYVLIGALAAFTKDRWTSPDQDIIWRIAFISMFLGLGMLVGAIFMSLLGSRRQSFWLGMVGMGVSGACMLALAFTPSYTVAIALCFIAGFFGNQALVVINTLTQSLSADYIRGRVFGIRDMTDNLSNIVVNAIIWLMPGADAWMLPALIGTATLLIVVAGASAWIELMRGPLYPMNHRRKANFFWRLNQLFCLAMHRVQWRGRSNVPLDGPVLMASNHTTGLDPFVVQSGMNRMVHWIMLRSYEFKIAAPLWRTIRPISLDLTESNRSQLRQVLERLEQGEIVGVFPEGSLQRDKRELGPLRPGIAMMARRSKAPIMPVWIEGTPRRKNMLWHFLQPSHTTVTFGRPYHPEPNASADEVLDQLKARLLELGEQHGE